METASVLCPSLAENESLDLSGKRCLVLVAHPDDETLWAGGLMIRFPQAKWTVACCTRPRRDPVRLDRFVEACRILGGTPIVWNIPEPMAYETLDLSSHLDILKEIRADFVFTHNQRGEYGHLHHRCVHEFVVSIHQQATWWLFTFGQGNGALEAFCVTLSDAELEKKVRALMSYDHTLPYRGMILPKWHALVLEYGVFHGFDFRTERFHEVL